MTVAVNAKAQTTMGPQTQAIKQSTYLARSIKWLRAENLSEADKVIRKIVAIVAVVLLSLTLVGIYVIVKGHEEWKRQNALSKIKQPAVVQSSVTQDSGAVDTKAKEKADDKVTKEEAKEEAAAKEEEGVAKEETGVAKEEEGVAKEETGVAKEETGVAKEEEGVAKEETGVAKEETGVAKEEEGVAKEEEGVAKEEEGVAKEEAGVVKEEGAKNEGEPPAEIAVEQPKPQVMENGFPKPFDTLKRLNLFGDGNFTDVIIRVDRALLNGHIVSMPQGYNALKESIKNEMVLSQFYEEAKVLAHHLTIADFEGQEPTAPQYKQILITNLDIFINGLNKDKKFPENLFTK